MRIGAGIAALALMLLAGGWWFWSDLILLWPVAAALAKSAWVKIGALILAVAGKGFLAHTVEDLLGVLGRKFIAWLPGKAGQYLLVVLVPPVLRGTVKRLRRLVLVAMAHLRTQRARLPGGVIGLALSAAATLVIAVLGIVYFGAYLFVVFKFVPEFVWSALVWLWTWLVTFLFKFSMWRGLTRALGHFWDRWTPPVLRGQFRALRRRALRHAIHRRRVVMRGARRRYETWRGRKVS